MASVVASNSRILRRKFWNLFLFSLFPTYVSGKSTVWGPVAYRGGGGFGGSTPPHPEIPKALQNRAKLNPIVKTVKKCRS